MIHVALRWSARTIRAALWLVFFFAVIGIVALRYWIFPNVEAYREDIARSISEAAGQRITIGRILPGWEQLQPHLRLEEVTVYDRNDRPALALQNISGTVSWLSLLLGEVSLNTLSLEAPVLTIRRDRNGIVYAAGIALNQRTDDYRFSDWLLRQRRISIRDAVILWRDDMRAAPPLVLRNLDLELGNRRNRHRFVLSGIPPADLAQPITMSGNLTGGSLRDKSKWHGTIYSDVQHTDIARWKAWFDLPVEVAHGFGNLRLWLSLHPGGIREARLVASLRDAMVRIKPHLPQLSLAKVDGGIGVKTGPGMTQVRFERLAAITADGVALQPFDFSLGVERPAQKPMHGTVSGKALDLAKLAYFAAFFDLPADARATLKALSPRGTIQTLDASWTGTWQQPETYTVETRFHDLGLAAYKMLPAFSNLSGTINANERKGNARVEAVNAMFYMPNAFREALPISRLTAKSDWRWRKKLIELDLNELTLSNAHLHGSLKAFYRAQPQGLGALTLTGKLDRADAREVYRYLPLTVSEDARSWLRHALKAGHSNDVRFELRGNLDHFPFDRGRPGTFRVQASFHDGLLNYADEWPAIEAIEGSLLFNAARMEVKVDSARVFRSRLSQIVAVIPDLMNKNEVLELSGKADALTDDMLRFIDQSPVRSRIHNTAQGIRASGNGRLELAFRMPLRRSEHTTLRGSYVFLDNTLQAEFLPPLRKINGTLAFTKDSVTARGLSMEALGGPLKLNVASADDQVRIDALGHFTVAGLREFGEIGLLKHLDGGSDWRGGLVLRKTASSIAVESNLQGVQSNLPDPMAKKAAEATPLRLERKTSGSGDVININYNRTMNAVLARRIASNGRSEIERGHVNLNGPATLPEKRGVALDAALRFIDIDAWRAALKPDALTGPANRADIASLVSAIHLRADSVDLFGKRMNEVKLEAQSTPNGWRGQIASREATGDLTWLSDGKGLLRAQLKNLQLPSDAPGTTAKAADVRNASRDPLPALEIMAENFAYGDKKLGRLELSASNQGRDWRIDKILITNPDAILSMDGRWRDWLVQPKTEVNLMLEIKDAGKFFARIGYPNTLKRGTATLSGQFAWLGGPAAFNFETMSGNFSLQAEKGQFLKADPGFAKLLGILSLQALPRRITLDFRDIFSEGFAFDTITGTMQMTRGVLFSNDFKMRGPSANVTMSGGTNLALETLSLNVRIVPVLGGSVAVAGALLGGPVVGLGTLLVQKALRDPIDQMAAFEYSISGTWDNPHIVKLSRRSETSE